jgi:uncharacterized membrane protein YjjB (DUF3815 family)
MDMDSLDIVLAVAKDFAIAFVVACCWGVLFGSPKRILYAAGLLGGMGHCIRFILLQLDMGLITATLAGSLAIGFVGIYAAHKVNSPPVVFTMPACITMIPGMYAYKTMLAGIKMTDMDVLSSDPSILMNMSHNFVLTASLLFTLAIGISVGVLLFRKSSVKHISLKDSLKNIVRLK